MAVCLKPDLSDHCCCPPMSVLAEACPPTLRPKSDSKYFHEVGAEMIGNQLIIRMEKDKSKRKRKSTWEPPCDCDVIEIKRPTSTKGPRIVNGGDNNQILFRVHSKTHLNKKSDPNYKPQAIAYKINRCNTEPDNHCRKITVYPHLGGPISQEIYTDHITEGCEDIYLLRVKKKNDMPENGNKRNLEVELHTPKPPPKSKLTATSADETTEYSESNVNGGKSGKQGGKNGKQCGKNAKKCSRNGKGMKKKDDYRCRN
ncbi:uncharacterized protein LOC131670724 [Phymastichus coffea]|uniref:uncharacterized protein LOC131670724 n=1 Tax=Phymastichus coffea TaxID=108790 RepID=UPI00273B51DB|nr:uncharacterized protein LOC131670724 [Phymastichus coffea]